MGDRLDAAASQRLSAVNKNIVAAAAVSVALATAGLLTYAATKPDAVKVQRSTKIAAAPGRLFPLIDDIRAFNNWSPDVREDPSMQLRYEGAAFGPGAGFTWDSEKAGAGHMEVVETVPTYKVVMRLDFTKPMQATKHVEFTKAPTVGGSQVSWATAGPMPYLHKLMSIFFDVDEMVGTDVEAGLAKLKSLAERA